MRVKGELACAALGLTVLAAAVTGRRPIGAEGGAASANTGQDKAPPTPGYTLLTAADVRRAFGQIPQTPPTNKKIIDAGHYNAAVARVRGRNGPVEHHRTSDRLFFVTEGAATMRVGGRITDARETSPGEYRSQSGTGYAEYREVKLTPGAVLSVPRDTPYQLMAQDGDVSFIVVRMN